MNLHGWDPGSTDGAGVVLSGRDTVAAWCTYKRMGPGDYRLTLWTGEQRREGSIGSGVQWWLEVVGCHTGEDVADGGVLVIEGLFVPHKWSKASPAMIIPLAKSSGEIAGAYGMAPAWEPVAVDTRKGETGWRFRQLGLRNNCPAAQAEAYAVKAAATAFDWPSSGGKAPTKAERGALAEAAWIARDGWVNLARR